MRHFGISLCAVAVLAVACYSLPSRDFLYDKESAPDSEEHGQSLGTKRTNCRCGWTNKASGRIINGKNAQANEYPHMAALARLFKANKVQVFCGSSIINERVLLSAAHCTHGEDGPLGVIVGVHDITFTKATPHTKIHEIEKYINHEDYNPDTELNDITLLVLKTKIQFNDFVGPICMPMKPLALEGEWVKVTGWGHTKWKGNMSPVLNKVFLKVIKLRDCAGEYDEGDISVSKPTQFCTYKHKKDSCQGDSGGPVTWLDPATNRYTLVGAVSYGMECATESPGVNTDIQKYIPWIQKTMKVYSKGETQLCHRVD